MWGLYSVGQVCIHSHGFQFFEICSYRRDRTHWYVFKVSGCLWWRILRHEPPTVRFQQAFSETPHTNLLSTCLRSWIRCCGSFSVWHSTCTAGLAKRAVATISTHVWLALKTNSRGITRTSNWKHRPTNDQRVNMLNKVFMFKQQRSTRVLRR